MKVLKAGIAFLCLFGIALGLYFSISKDDPIRKALSTIPADEKLFLEYFFRDLLLREGGAYVLNGTKPITEEDFESPTLREVFFFGNRFLKSAVLLKKGFEIWNKYQHLFPSTKYALLCYQNKTDGTFQVLLINKKAVVNEIEKNIEDFKAILGPTITPTALLEKIISEDKHLSEILNEHTGLFGMLLGYGKHNSQLFYQREMLQDQIEDNQFIPKRFELIEEKLNAAEKRFLATDPKKRRNRLIFTSLPAFVFDPEHPETQKLLKSYEEQRKEITKSYQDVSFLETFLKKFTS